MTLVCIYCKYSCLKSGYVNRVRRETIAIVWLRKKGGWHKDAEKYDLPKHQWTAARLHSVTSRKIVLFIVTALRTADLIQQDSLAQQWNTSKEEVADGKSKSKDGGTKQELRDFSSLNPDKAET